MDLGRGGCFERYIWLFEEIFGRLILNRSRETYVWRGEDIFDCWKIRPLFLKASSKDML